MSSGFHLEVNLTWSKWKLLNFDSFLQNQNKLKQMKLYKLHLFPSDSFGEVRSLPFSHSLNFFLQSGPSGNNMAVTETKTFLKGICWANMPGICQGICQSWKLICTVLPMGTQGMKPSSHIQLFKFSHLLWDQMGIISS